MAGRISQVTIDQVRARVALDQLVSNYVTLRPAGADSLKGLCPFHDEKTPSFHVRPSAGFWHCFGCDEGGDAVSFVRKIEHLDFPQAIEFLANQLGITVEYSDRPERSQTFGQRQRLVDALRTAEQYYRQQLSSPQAQVARDFMAQRAFGPQDCEHFGIGYAPRGWDNVSNLLRSRGFTDAEILAAGLASQGRRGNIYDRFRGRLMWPIRDQTGTTVGFGARKLHEDDEGPKYLNSPETALYKKSTVLYGLDLAKRDIARQRQVVIVEGYTDVMAAHLAGITTAVATCGTAFGSGHTKIIRRLLGDVADAAAGVQLAGGRSYGGEVVFTFDGDEAGQKAALRAFEEDNSFASQTFVAVAKEGMDPCDLRLSQGDAALRALVESRVPLFEFVLKSFLSRLDLSAPEGRVQGLRAGAPIVAQIRDRALRSEYTRLLAGWLGMDEGDVRAAVREAARRPRPLPSEVPVGQRQPGGPGAGGTGMAAGRGPGGVQANADGGGPNGGSASAPVARLGRLRGAHLLEGQVLASVLQYPYYAVGSGFDDIANEAFKNDILVQIHQAIQVCGGLTQFGRDLAQAPGNSEQQRRLVATRAWQEAVRQAGGEYLSSAIAQLCVVPLPATDSSGMRALVLGFINALLRRVLVEKEAALQAQLRRLTEGSAEHTECFERLMSVTEQRLALSTQF